MNLSHPKVYLPPARWLAALLSVVAAAGCDLLSRGSLDTTRVEDHIPALSLPQSAAEHWPGFRGAGGTGVSSAENLPVIWDDRLGVRWTTAVPGSGNSSPVVWDNAVYLTTAAENRELKLLCFDRAGGSLRWEQSAGHATGRRHAKNGDASPTPVTNGEKVFAFFGDVGMICCDLQGNLLWQKSLGDLDHPWGLASSPILFDDLVIQLCDSESESHLIALHQATGDVVWKTPRDSSGCWSTPVVMSYGPPGAEQFSVVVNGTGRSAAEDGFVIGYDPLTGIEQWRVQGATDASVPTPLVVGDEVVVASGRKGNTMRLRPTTASNPVPTAADERSTPGCEVVWVIPHSGPYVATGVAYQGLLYQIGDQGVLRCYDAATGDLRYEERLPGNFTAGLIAGDEKVFATSETGRTYVLAAGAQFALLSENDVHAPVLATPAVAGGDLFIRTDHQLLCIPSQLPEPASVNEAAPFDPESDVIE